MKKKNKRNLFSELMTGVGEMALHRQGKITLKTSTIKAFVFPKLTPSRLKALRTKLNISRAVLANMIQVNVRTLENWEQGRSAIPQHAAALLLLLDNYPDTIERLREIAA